MNIQGYVQKEVQQAVENTNLKRDLEELKEALSAPKEDSFIGNILNMMQTDPEGLAVLTQTFAAGCQNIIRAVRGYSTPSLQVVMQGIPKLETAPVSTEEESTSPSIAIIEQASGISIEEFHDKVAAFIENDPASSRMALNMLLQ